MKLLSSLSVVATLTVVCAPSQALAWGDLGHEVVCEIAFQELRPDSRAVVKRLIRSDPDFRTFAKSCTWPDHPRIRGKEHFVNLDRGSRDFGTQVCPAADKCVVSAVMNDSRDLALFDDESERLRLLKSLGHWVGDLHQPVHVSFADDKGANKIRVGDPCDSNLHSVWDTCIIKETIGRDAREVAIELRSEITSADRRDWIPSTIDQAAVVSWAQESLAITLDPAVEYCVKVGDECWYEADRREFAGGDTKRVDADHDYLNRHSGTVRTRLKMAGVRMGAILNTIFSDQETVDVASLEDMTAMGAAARAAVDEMEAGSVDLILERIRAIEIELGELAGQL